MTKKSPKLAIPFRCQECGRKFLTLASATRATIKGCKCGSVDIDEDTGPASELKKAIQ